MPTEDVRIISKTLTDEELYAFCYDNYPGIYQHFDSQTDRGRVTKWLINGPPEHPLPSEKTKEEQYFSLGLRAHIKGDFWEAKRYYRMLLDIDPFYPRAEEELAMVEQALGRHKASDDPHFLYTRLLFDDYILWTVKLAVITLTIIWGNHLILDVAGVIVSGWIGEFFLGSVIGTIMCITVLRTLFIRWIPDWAGCGFWVFGTLITFVVSALAGVSSTVLIGIISTSFVIMVLIFALYR